MMSCIHNVVRVVGAEVCEEQQTIDTFSTSPRAYIWRAVRLDIQIGSMSSGSPWSICPPFEFEPFSILISMLGKR